MRKMTFGKKSALFYNNKNEPLDAGFCGIAPLESFQLLTATEWRSKQVYHRSAARAARSITIRKLR